MQSVSVTDENGISVLIISVRNFRHQAANGTLYEFEDKLAELSNATLYSPVGESPLHRKVYRCVKYITSSNRVAHRVSFYPSTELLTNKHDLIIVLADNTYQLHLLNCVEGWREHRAAKACYLSELWPGSLDSWRVCREPFQDFDHIFVGLSNAVPILSERLGVSCSFLPLGVDTDVFSPAGQACDRCIDVAYIGRRMPEVHKSLMVESARQQLFYYFDTAKAQKLIVDDHVLHRQMYSSILKRSKFAIAFPAKLGISTYTKNASEIGARYYEFAAAGAIVLGGKPENENFEKLFDWKDSVVEVDEYSIASIVRELSMDKEYQAKISAQNAANALLKHDWVYRWEGILDRFSLPHSESMLQRKKYLHNKAEQLLNCGSAKSVVE